MLARLRLVYLQKLTNAEIQFRNFPTVILPSSRSKTTSVSDERVVITDDGSTVVCWHPPKQFPYECSRPLPEEEAKPQNTVLKVENKSQIYNAFKLQDEHATREELMKLTHTTKHRWAPNNLRFRKIYKRIKSDREWL